MIRLAGLVFLWVVLLGAATAIGLLPHQILSVIGGCTVGFVVSTGWEEVE